MDLLPKKRYFIIVYTSKKSCKVLSVQTANIQDELNAVLTAGVFVLDWFKEDVANGFTEEYAYQVSSELANKHEAERKLLEDTDWQKEVDNAKDISTLVSHVMVEADPVR